MDRVHKKLSYFEEWGNKESVYTNYISINLLGGFATNLELGKSIKIHLHTRDSMGTTQISVFKDTGTMHWCRSPNCRG